MFIFSFNMYFNAIWNIIFGRKFTIYFNTAIKISTLNDWTNSFNFTHCELWLHWKVLMKRWCIFQKPFCSSALKGNNAEWKMISFGLEFYRKYADICPLLDVEDMVMFEKPDWKCVFTYVQSFFRRFRNGRDPPVPTKKLTLTPPFNPNVTPPSKSIEVSPNSDSKSKKSDEPYYFPAPEISEEKKQSLASKYLFWTFVPQFVYLLAVPILCVYLENERIEMKLSLKRLICSVCLATKASIVKSGQRRSKT